MFEVNPQFHTSCLPITWIYRGPSDKISVVCAGLGGLDMEMFGNLLITLTVPEKEQRSSDKWGWVGCPWENVFLWAFTCMRLPANKDEGAGKRLHHVWLCTGGWAGCPQMTTERRSERFPAAPRPLWSSVTCRSGGFISLFLNSPTGETEACGHDRANVTVNHLCFVKQRKLYLPRYSQILVGHFSFHNSPQVLLVCNVTDCNCPDHKKLSIIKVDLCLWPALFFH